MPAALFLDRDGVIIQNRSDYVRTWEQVEFLPGALEALAIIAPLPLAVVVVTNQSAVGRGLLSPGLADEINQRMVTEIERAGGRIDRVYMCPHAPQIGCDCRKPRPGMLLQAQRELDIQMPASWMVGDALTDLQAGHAAGVERLVMLRTGRGETQLRLPAARTMPAFTVMDSLRHAVEHLLLSTRGQGAQAPD